MDFRRIWLGLLWLIPVVFNPFGSNVFSLFRVSMLSFWLVGMMFIWIYDVFFRDKKIEGSCFQMGFVLICLVFFLLNYVSSETPGSTLLGSVDRLQGIATYLMYFGLGFFLYQYRKLLDNKFFGFGLGVFSLVSLHAIMQKIGYGRFSAEMYGVYSERVYGTVGHPNFLGQLLAPMVLLSVYVWRSISKKMWKILVFMSGVLNLLALILTENRASWLALFFVVLLWLVLELDLKNKYKIGVVVLGSLIMCGALYFLAPSLRSLSTRFLLWKSSFPLVFQDVWFGSGLESFKSVYQIYAPAELLNYEPVYSVAARSHNFLLDIWIEAGLFGLLLIFIYLLNGLKKYNGLTTCVWLVSFLPWLLSFPLVEHWIFGIIFFVSLFKDEPSSIELKIDSKPWVSAVIGFVLVCSVGNAYFYVDQLRADFSYSFGNYMIGNEDTADDELGIEMIMNSFQSNQMNYEYNIRFINFMIGMSSVLDKDKVEESVNIAFENMEALRGQDFFYKFMKGQYFTGYKDFEVAEDYYEEALMLSNDNPRILREYTVMNYYRGSCGGVIENYNKYLEKIPDTWKMVGSGELSWEDSEKLRIYMKNIGGQEFWVLMGFAEECSRELGLDGEANQYLDYIKKAQT
jgi:O-antigen ligase